MSRDPPFGTSSERGYVVTPEIITSQIFILVSDAMVTQNRTSYYYIVVYTMGDDVTRVQNALLNAIQTEFLRSFYHHRLYSTGNILTLFLQRHSAGCIIGDRSNVTYISDGTLCLWRLQESFRFYLPTHE
jgi:hypothetical protein